MVFYVMSASQCAVEAGSIISKRQSFCGSEHLRSINAIQIRCVMVFDVAATSHTIETNTKATTSNVY
jgi:hypothetical protein